MGEISSIYSIGKLYIEKLFFKSAKKAEQTAIEKVEQVENIAEPIKITSKQIEGYYKRYGKHLASKKQKPQKIEPKIKEPTLEDIQLQKECDAYNKIRHLSVSAETLKELEHNFEQKKQIVQDIILLNKDGLQKEFIQEVKSIENPKQLAKILRLYPIFATEALNKKYEITIYNLLKRKPMTLNLQKQILQDDAKISDVYLNLIKAVTEESKDPRVIQIEKYIKFTYDMDYVHLENLEEAKKVLKTIKIAVKNDIPLPKNIVITPFTSTQHSGLNMSHSIIDHSVLIRSQKEIDTATENAYKQFVHPKLQPLAQNLREEDRRWFSTRDILHLYVHEFCHNKFFMEMLVPTKLKLVPAQFNKTINQLGVYAKTSRNELATELKAKSILSSLNKDEEELLKFFE